MLSNTARPASPRRVATLWGPDGAIFGLRLSGVRGESPMFRPATPAELWSAVHQAGLTVSVRWLVLPASTVGAPGHIEVYLLVQVGSDSPFDTLPDELRSLLVLGFPRYRFEPIATQDELLFALAPFGEWAWSLALGHAVRDRSPGGKCAVQRESEDRGTPLTLSPAQADPAQAVALLATARVASMLEWTLSPAGGAHATRPDWPAPLNGGRNGSPLSFDCQVTWSGSADSSPSLVGVSLAHALGAREGRWTAFTRTSPKQMLPDAPILHEPNCPSRVVVAHTALPDVLPPAAAAMALVPALRPTLSARLPQIDLPEVGALLGHAVDGRPVRLSLTDRLRHVWALGQTGTGKTTFLANRILADLEEGHGVAVFDPHGELVRTVRDLMPANRRADLTFIDASDQKTEQPVLNPLECQDVRAAHLQVGQMVEFLVSLWPREMTGPVWEQAATNALLVLAARFEQPGTIADLPRMFLDSDFRTKWLASTDLAERVPEAALWWKGSWAKQSDFTKGEHLDYFVSKFNRFFSDPVLTAILGRPRSTINLRQIMDGGGVLLCNLGRGGVNPLAAALLAAVFMQSSFNAALSRAELPPDQRRPFFVYCDEFQRIAGPSTGSMLSEVRKFGVGLVLAHQFVDQLDDDVIAAVLGNVGTKIVFRVGARDARRLVGYQPSVSIMDLIGMPNFSAFVELLVGGVPSSPFTLRCLPPPAGIATLALDEESR